MTILDPADDGRVAVAAAEAGAGVVRSMYGGPLARFDKSAGDFATSADVEAERAIIAVLRAARPGDAVTDLADEPVHSGAGGLIAAADRETHGALLELVRGQGVGGR